MRPFALTLLAFYSTAFGQTAGQETWLRDLYQKTFTALEAAKTEDDMRRVAEMMDVREWLSLDPLGLPISRVQANAELKSLLAAPPKNRVPQMDILWTDTTAASAVAVLWVYNSREIADPEGRYGAPGEKHPALFGALVRDTFARTDAGWRRVRHEKIIPNQLLSVDGHSLITPPLAAKLK